MRCGTAPGFRTVLCDADEFKLSTGVYSISAGAPNLLRDNKLEAQTGICTEMRGVYENAYE